MVGALGAGRDGSISGIARRPTFGPGSEARAQIGYSYVAEQGGAGVHVHDGPGREQRKRNREIVVNLQQRARAIMRQARRLTPG